MYNMVKTELKKLVCRGETYICVVIMVASLFFGISTELEMFFKNNIPFADIMLYYYSIFTGIADPVMPVICVIPIVLSIWDENNSGYGNMVLVRTKKSTYMVGKLIAAAFSGMYVVIMGSFIFFVLLRLMGVDNAVVCINSIEGISDTVYYEWALEGRWLSGLMLIVFSFSLTTIPWTLLALVCGQLVKNKYLLIAMPVLINKVMIFVCCYIDSLYYCNPLTWNTVTSVIVTEKLGGLFYQLKVMTIVMLICSILYIMLFRRRFRHG